MLLALRAAFPKRAPCLSRLLSTAEPMPTPINLDAPPTPANNPFPTENTPPQIYGLHCHSTKTNTIVSVTKPDGGVHSWFSGGRSKFKGANRASYEAGYQCAKASFDVLREILKMSPSTTVHIYFKGFGQGRDAMRTALLATEGEGIRDAVRCVTDRTPIKIGGTRSKKARRL